MLPTPELCALMAYENLKDDLRTDLALAWSSLGQLTLLLQRNDMAIRAYAVARSAQAVAEEDSENNRLAFQQALAAWIHDS